MWLERFYCWLCPRDIDNTSYITRFWLGAALLVSLVFALLGMRYAFSSPYVIQDDARQHVFWMLRFVEPGVFPHDAIADYFQAVAPLGYTSFYRLFAVLGVHPFLLNKLLPLALGLITTVFCFRLVMRLFPLPSAAFFASLFLNQCLWLKDDLVSATPRAFVYPLFVMFLYFLLNRSLWPCLLTIVLQGLFYPQLLLITGGILALRLFTWRKGWPHWLADPEERRLILLGLAAVSAVILPFLLSTSGYGPTISSEMARVLPEFMRDGRSSFFTDNLWTYWVRGSRSGLLPTEWFNWPSLYFLVLAGLGCSLPWLMRHPERFPLVQRVTGRIRALPQIAVASFGLFLLAHAVLFKLHLPSRYTHHSARILVAISAGIVLVIVLEAALRYLHATVKTDAGWKTRFLKVTMAASLAMMLSYPWWDSEFPVTHLVHGTHPKLYAFFKGKPPDIVIASVASEANNLPAFAHRTVLVANEYAIPYHWGYYQAFRQQAFALMDAHYTLDPERLRAFIRRNHIDYFLLEDHAFTPGYIAHHPWIGQYKTLAQNFQHRLTQGPAPALSQALGACQVFRDGSLIVIDAHCIAGH